MPINQRNQPLANPLECPVPAEVVLANPPLELALAQIRFSPMLAINQPDSPMVASFQEAVQAEYPEYQGVMGLSVSLPDGVSGQAEAAMSPRHVFKDAEQKWEISLTHEFVALTTTAYRTKGEFARKIRVVADAVAKHINPHRVTRLGVRFVDRISGDDLRDIDKYVNPEFLGPYIMFGGNLDSLITEALIPFEDRKMIARWGHLPPGQTLGVNIPVHNEPSWILDSDIYTGQFPGFIPEEIANHAESLAGRVYAFFRGVFKDEFIRKCGGKL